MKRFVLRAGRSPACKPLGATLLDERCTFAKEEK